MTFMQAQSSSNLPGQEAIPTPTLQRDPHLSLRHVACLGTFVPRGDCFLCDGRDGVVSVSTWEIRQIRLRNQTALSLPVQIFSVLSPYSTSFVEKFLLCLLNRHPYQEETDGSVYVFFVCLKNC